MTVEDLRESRLVVCDPAPIPADELQRTYDWLKSWGMLEETASPLQLINPTCRAAPTKSPRSRLVARMERPHCGRVIRGGDACGNGVPGLRGRKNGRSIRATV